MPLHIDRGKEGEKLAGVYLERNGFKVEVCNWRSGHHEIDIIATRSGMIHFIEVKTRHTLNYGYPEESVSKRKFRSMTDAACCYLSSFPEFLRIQYDILSVLRLPGKPVEYLLIEDVYL